MQTTDDVAALDATIRHQCPPVCAATVEHRNLVLIRPADNDHVYAGGECIGGFQRLKVGPGGESELLHDSAPKWLYFHRPAICQQGSNLAACSIVAQEDWTGATPCVFQWEFSRAEPGENNTEFLY